MRMLPALALLLLPAIMSPAVSAATAPADCRYDVTIEGAEAKALDVAIHCTAAGISGFRMTEQDAAPWIKDFHLDGSTAGDDGSWSLPRPSSGPVAASYRVDLDGLAAADDSVDGARRIGSRALPDAGNTAFGRLANQTVRLPAIGGGNAELEVTVLDGTMQASPAELARWVLDTGQAVANYWGGFPVDRASIILVPVAGRHGLPFGRVIGVGGASVLILVGADSKVRELYDEI